MKNYLTGASLIAVSAALSTAAHAQVDQIVVTATKRVENAQDIPVAVQALGADNLEELRVDSFSDYLVQLPGVTAGGSGPGQNTIYIRGLASTTPNLTTAGVAGLAPNVALYLDEQPLSQPGRNLDVYAADLERVEVLPGPQGTLFGASSQAGTIRLITNKPRLGEFQASAQSGLSTTKGGEMSAKFEGMLNVPVTDKLALRIVGYIDDRGGYIDNVPGTRNASESARFRDASAIRANGVPVGAGRDGFQSPSQIADNVAADPTANAQAADLSGVTFLDADNANLVEKDFNDTRYTGFRGSALYEINNDWRVTVTHARQDLQSDGVFFTDPDLDEYEIQRYEEDRLEDDFNNTSWTVEGRIGALEALYTGAFTDRDTSQRVDYSDYLFAGQYLPYYICDGSVTYPSGAPAGTCQEPNLYVDSVTETHVFTHELRFNTPAEKRLRATAGAFYKDLRLDERNDYAYPGSLEADIFGQPVPGHPNNGFAPNFPFTTGYFSDAGPFPPGVIFRNDIRRTDKQFGFFGETSFELVPDRLTLTFGTRYYDIEVDFEGGANASFCNSYQADVNAFGTDISDIYNGDGEVTFRGTCDASRHITYTEGQTVADIQAIDPLLSENQATQIFNALSAPDTASTNGFIFKGNISWTPTDNLLFYATYSEGFRPGLLNRPGGAAGPNGFFVPFAIDTDEVTNYELGWKTQLFENQLQFNGNAFFVDGERLQTTIFDPSITNLFFSDNAANVEILGVEADVVYAPYALEGLTLTGAFSVLDTEIKEVLTPTDDVAAGGELAYAPNFQGNVRARYEWNVSSDYVAHVQSQVVYSGSSFSDIVEINKAKVNAWTTVSASAGLTGEQWSVEVFAENLGNTYGELANNFVYDRYRTTVLRPRTIGVRFGYVY